MKGFFDFFNEIVDKYSMRLEVYYSNTSYWCISVSKKECGRDATDINIVNIQSCDMNLCFAKAQVILKEWLLKHEGGY